MNAIPPPEARDLERLRYWQGQTLRSRDFRDQRSFDEQFRWWHNRAMHGAYGVARGFQHGYEEGWDHLRVGPGKAYDWFGRELILLKERTVLIPRRDKELALLLRYKESTDYLRKMELGTACLPGSCTLFHEDVCLAWKPAVNLEPQDGVVLARLYNGKLQWDAIPVRALSRPRIEMGTTLAGATAWQKWKWPKGETIGAQVTVDTSAAGFRETPGYFAWLQHQTDKSKSASVLLNYYWEHIASANPQGFVFRVLPLIEKRMQQTIAYFFSDAVEDFINSGAYSVGWLAIQCDDCLAQHVKERKERCEYPQ